jgi:hypothetical protein
LRSALKESGVKIEGTGRPRLRNIRRKKRGGGLRRAKAAGQSPKASTAITARFHVVRSEETTTAACLAAQSP